MLTLQLKPPTQHHWPINELARFVAWTAVLCSGAQLSCMLMRPIDDATSAVDARTEEAIHNSLREVVEGRTTLLIAHRLSTLRLADRVAVLADGRVIEQGSHDELMKLGGRYARLFELQARAYR